MCIMKVDRSFWEAIFAINFTALLIGMIGGMWYSIILAQHEWVERVTKACLPVEKEAINWYESRPGQRRLPLPISTPIHYQGLALYLPGPRPPAQPVEL